MSRGPGSVQRAIIAVFENAPTARLTIEDLCGLIFAGEVIERKHKESVRRALNKIAADAGLLKSRVALSGAFGWRHIVGCRST